MPVSLKSYDINQWVWELKEALETAHTFVRQNTGTSIQRQKRYHDVKANYEQLSKLMTPYMYTFQLRKLDRPQNSVHFRGVHSNC